MKTKSVKQNFLFLCMMFGLVSISFLSCSKDEPDLDPSADPLTELPEGDLTFANVLARGGTFETYPESRTTDTLSIGETNSEDYSEEVNGSVINQRYLCTTSKVSILDGSGSFPIFNPSAEVIYPANLLQGKTLSNTTPSIIPVKRAGGTISYNLNNGNLVSSFSVEEVDKASIQNAMNNIIANSPDLVPANFSLDIQEVHSESQLAIEMGIDVERYKAKVSADMSFSTENSYNRFLVKLRQEYYTMSFNIPTSKDDLFSPSVTPKDLSTYVQEDNPATFISSVTYGRIFYMLIESTSSRQEMSAKLNASYGSFKNKIEGSVELDAFNSLNEVKIKVIAYGGDAQGTFELAGESNIGNIAEQLAQSTDIRAGLPLSYVVRSVERPDIVLGTKLATEYDAVSCELRGSLPPLGYSKIAGIFEDGIGAATAVAGSNAILFNGAGTEYVWFNGNTGNVSQKFSIKAPNDPLGNVRFDAVGAAVLYIPGEIWLYDENSLEFVIFKFNPNPYAGNNNSIPTSYIGTQYFGPFNTNEIHNANLASGESFPFGTEGFDASAYLGFKQETINEDALFKKIVRVIKKYRHIYFQKGQGNYYAYEDYIVEKRTTIPYIGDPTTETIISRKWTEKRNLYNVSASTFALDIVGAACKITLGNEDLKLLYFSEDGTEFFVRNDLYGVADGPYIIE